MVEAPAVMIFGSEAGEPIVLVGPASPLPVVTVTPALIAASSASLTTSRRPSSGNGFAVNDSLRMLTWSTVTA